MDSLGTIVKSWQLYLQGSSYTKQLIEKRVAICMQCPHKTNAIGFLQCGLCFCPLSGKTAHPDAECPDKPKRWTKVNDESYF